MSEKMEMLGIGDGHVLVRDEDGSIKSIDFKEIDRKHPLVRDHQSFVLGVWMGAASHRKNDDVFGAEEAVTEC